MNSWSDTHVSTEQQDLTAQRNGLHALGVGDDRIYVDHGLTGANRDRPGLRFALAACRAGDTLAERRGAVVLRARAVESGVAYRPLVDAFARPAAPLADDPRFASVRPTLARVLPGWSADTNVLAPMADPAAVLAEALIRLLRDIAPDGAVLLVDDVHWADEDTVSVLTYLTDSVEELPLALLLSARAEPLLQDHLERLSASSAVEEVPLSRLGPTEVARALRAHDLPELPQQRVDQLVAAADGLPLVLDEFVRQLRDRSSATDELDIKPTTLAVAVACATSHPIPGLFGCPVRDWGNRCRAVAAVTGSMTQVWASPSTAPCQAPCRLPPAPRSGLPGGTHS